MTSTQLQTLAAVADRVIPPEETSPGAVSADVPAFLLDLLTREMAPAAVAIERFLDALGADFAAAAPAEQDSRLRACEREPAFGHLVEMIHEGYWTSEAGLQAVGFEVRG